MPKRVNPIAFLCLILALVCTTQVSFANDCLTPPSSGLEWYPQATGLRVGAPTEPPWVQVGGHIAPGYQILLDGVAMTPDEQGLFGIVFAVPAEPTRFEWTLVDPGGRRKTQVFNSTWQQPFPVQAGQAIPAGVYQLPDYLVFSCEPGPSLEVPGAEWAPFVSVGLLALMADGNRSSISPEIAWVPRVELLTDLHWVSNLGFSMVRYDSARIFPFIEAQVALRYRFLAPLSVQVGGGVHLLFGNESMKINWQAGLVYNLEKPIWGFGEFFASYGSYTTAVGDLTGLKAGAVWTF